jgi:hypothetical protein
MTLRILGLYSGCQVGALTIVLMGRGNDLRAASVFRHKRPVFRSALSMVMSVPQCLSGAAERAISATRTVLPYIVISILGSDAIDNISVLINYIEHTQDME